MRTATKSMAILAVLLVLGGCASRPAHQASGDSSQSTDSAQTVSPETSTSETSTDSSNGASAGRVLGSAVVGAAGGAMGGMAVGLGMCATTGPLAPLCLMIVAPPAIAIGTVGGAVVGAVSGAKATNWSTARTVHTVPHNANETDEPDETVPLVACRLGDVETTLPEDDCERKRSEILESAALPAVPAAADPEQFSGVELRQMLAGNTLAGTNERGDKVFIYHDARGTMRGRANWKYEDAGTWELDSEGRYCRRWRKWRDAARDCFVFTPAGAGQFRVSAIGKSYDGTYHIEHGDPQALGGGQ